VLAGTAALGACDSDDEPRPRAASGAPNVVVVMTDDQRADELEVMPRVKRLLARRGTVYSRSFASFPLCCPSRATFLTGQYAHNHGVRDNRAEAGGGVDALDDSETLPVWLGRAGYSTAHVGKYLNGYRGPDAPEGWDEWHATIDPTTYLSYGFSASRNGQVVRPRGYQGDWVTRRADALVGELPQPFFLSVAYLAPHEDRGLDRGRCRETARPAPRHFGRIPVSGFRPPPSFDEARAADKPSFIRAQPRLTPALERAQARAWACRRESLLTVDEGVGALVQALRSRGVLRDTLFVFTSDNGYFLGEHRLPDNKINVYEEAVRVPLVIRGPGVLTAKREPRLVTNVDLAATILDAAGAEAGREPDGISLLRRPPPGRVLLLENLAKGEPRFARYAAVRTRRHVYVEYENGERELYDLRRDPHQLRSRQASPALAGLRRRLERLRDCAGEDCR
jgi:arylsulfatase A-like enzyme